MSCMTSFSNQRKDRIQFLPIIDLNPTDESCIYSTLLFVIDQAKILNVQTPSITFDQPLWLTATGIIKESNLDIICRLGGFHTMISFLGSLGGTMRGSGLSDLFSEVYADHSVQHILPGKAVSRASRSHLLVEAALTSILHEMCLESGLIDAASLQALTEIVVKPPDQDEADEAKDLTNTEEYIKVSNVTDYKNVVVVRANVLENSQDLQLYDCHN